MFEYLECNDANVVYHTALENKLHLPRGIMMRTIRMAADESGYDFKGVIVHSNGKCCGVGCIVRSSAEAPFKLMLYVEGWLRGMGIGLDLVRLLMTAANGERLFCFPWESRSVLFYRKCLELGLVSLDNFQAYERRLVSDESLQWTTRTGESNGNRKGAEVQRI